MGISRQLHYIVAYGQIVAIFEKKTTGDAMHYVHTDHLGSLNVITNATGAIEQELSYDAWGNRRNPTTWVNLTTAPANLITSRGFTGHEHMDAYSLINMNGRLYDPRLGRFLSPDPFVANPTSTQDYNRYSYVVNNPLMFTDPSGYRYMYIERPWFMDISNERWSNWTGRSSNGSMTPHIDAERAKYAGSLGYSYDRVTGQYIDNYTRKPVEEYVAKAWAYSGAKTYYGDAARYVYASITGAGTSNVINPDRRLGYFGGFDNTYFDKDIKTSLYYIPGTNIEVNPADVLAGLVGGSGADSGGGDDAMDYIAAGIGAVNTYTGVTGDAFYSNYHWMQKNGKLQWNSESKQANYLYKRSNTLVKGITKNARLVSRGSGILGSAVSAYQFVSEPTYANAFDAVMGATTFIPVVGWAISGTYFISNIITVATTGKSIGEHIFGDATVY